MVWVVSAALADAIVEVVGSPIDLEAVMTAFVLGHGHYMLAADRRRDGERDYDLRCYNPWDSEYREHMILPPPTPLWHWAVW